MLLSWIPPRYLIYNWRWVKVIIRWEKSVLLPYALSLIVGLAHSSVTCSWQQCQKHEVNNLMGKWNEHKVNSNGGRLTFVHMKDRRESLSRDIAIIEYSKPIPNQEIWQGWIILCIDSEIYSISLKARCGLRCDHLKKMSISVGRNDEWTGRTCDMEHKTTIFLHQYLLRTPCFHWGICDLSVALYCYHERSHCLWVGS